MFIDITDKKEIEKKLAEREDSLRNALKAANQANVAKTGFLSTMSHEIRTPMNSIIGLDRIALDDENISTAAREYLEKTNGSAKHLLGIINGDGHVAKPIDINNIVSTLTEVLSGRQVSPSDK